MYPRNSFRQAGPERDRKRNCTDDYGGFLWGLAGVFGKYSFEYKGVMAPWLVNVRLIIAGIILLMRAYMVQKNGIFRIWKNKRHVFRMLVYE
ncbi:MAG: hypothetical protein ACLR2O_05935 [Coprococcus sp.]